MFVALSDLSDDERTTTITVPTMKMNLPERGYDTMIVRVPDELVSPPPATPGANPRVQLMLVRIAQDMAREMGETLRMSGWWVTRDPEVVKQRGAQHDCEDCREGVQRALKAMEEDDDVVMAVGVLSFA